MEPDAILERVWHVHELGEGKSPYHDRDSIFVWRAKFTLEHYQDKKFTGGFFQQHDAKYPRSCLTLDYTPETLEEVLGRFCAWMDRGYETDHVTINNGIDFSREDWTNPVARTQRDQHRHSARVPRESSGLPTR